MFFSTPRTVLSEFIGRPGYSPSEPFYSPNAYPNIPPYMSDIPGILNPHTFQPVAMGPTIFQPQTALEMATIRPLPDPIFFEPVVLFQEKTFSWLDQHILSLDRMPQIQTPIPHPFQKATAETFRDNLMTKMEGLKVIIPKHEIPVNICLGHDQHKVFVNKDARRMAKKEVGKIIEEFSKDPRYKKPDPKIDRITKHAYVINLSVFHTDNCTSCDHCEQQTKEVDQKEIPVDEYVHLVEEQWIAQGLNPEEEWAKVQSKFDEVAIDKYSKALEDPDALLSNFLDLDALPKGDKSESSSSVSQKNPSTQVELPKSILKPFDGLEEALLSMPLEVDANGLPYAKPQTYYVPSQITSFGEKKCEHGSSCFINGILNTYENAQSVAKALSEMQDGNQVDLIYNSTLGLQRDSIKQIYINDGYMIPAGKLLKEHIIGFFEKAEIGQVLHLNAHSQGGAILSKILPEIPEEYRDRMYVDTYGTAGYVDVNMAFQVRNFWHPKDSISKTADLKGWEQAKQDGSLFILEDEEKSAIQAHTLMNGYLKRLQQNQQAFAKGEL